MKRAALAVLAGLILNGCATGTGIMPMGDDTFMVSRQSNNIRKDPALLKAEAYQEANEYCSKENKRAHLVSSNVFAGGLGHLPSAEVDFTCVGSDSPRTPSSN